MGNMPSVRTVYDEQVQPYTPSLYMLSAPILGRYRTYPQYTRTPIPGAGFEPAKLVWGEQVMNLDGANGMRRPYPYGNYAAGVPLRGIDEPFRRFASVAQYLWAGGAQPTPEAINEYAKITAVGTFVGVPVALFLGYRWGKSRRSVRANRARRRGRR